jgi:transcriptional regulator with XRE-family HTH domain
MKAHIVSTMITTQPKVLPHYLRAWREARELSMADFAARLGLEKSVISRYETGERRISVALMLRMCAVLEITPNEFFFGPGAATLDDVARHLDVKDKAELTEIVKLYCDRRRPIP